MSCHPWWSSRHEIQRYNLPTKPTLGVPLGTPERRWRSCRCRCWWNSQHLCVACWTLWLEGLSRWSRWDEGMKSDVVWKFFFKPWSGKTPKTNMKLCRDRAWMRTHNFPPFPSFFRAKTQMSLGRHFPTPWPIPVWPGTWICFHRLCGRAESMVHAGRGCSIVSGQFHEGKDQLKKSTPKFKVAPEKWGWLEEGYFPFKKAYFQGYARLPERIIQDKGWWAK